MLRALRVYAAAQVGRCPYETGSAEADNRIVLPLDTAQQLYGKADQVNVVYVTVNDPANRSSVIDGVERIVGKKAAVQGLGE